MVDETRNLGTYPVIAQLLPAEIATESLNRRPLVTTTTGSLQIVSESPRSAPALRAADAGVADALESVLSDNTKRVYGAQWKLFDEWCVEMGLHSLPAEALTVARYLAVRAGHESPGRDQGD